MPQLSQRGRKRNSAYLLAERVARLLGMALVTFPGLLLVLPVQIVGERVAAQKAKEALAGSDVKIKAYVEQPNHFTSLGRAVCILPDVYMRLACAHMLACLPLSAYAKGLHTTPKLL